MTLEQIKATVSAMPEDQQDHLVAYLIHLRHARDPRVQEEITRRIDDQDPGHWTSVQELREKWKE